MIPKIHHLISLTIRQPIVVLKGNPQADSLIRYMIKPKIVI